ncbi:hypothetical protein BY457_11121 [Marinilabilia salmonicolor]|jgi:hypothetical protein|uniref:hypothetical protein n=1 Tax=Marinilabilia salmonicolor TaxID=989 RepID=UPI000D071724|nr:hypothetical protein [Marinilabilia salmonicolor]PRY97741.1 hypothetical protein BY457_11121 [Marinilabilia salmonicolor]
MNRKKAVLFGLFAVGTGIAVKKLWSLMDISDRVSFVISSFKIHNLVVPSNILDIAAYRVVLSVGIRIYNHSENTVNLQIPSVKAYYNGQPIGYSTPDASTTVIMPNSAGEKSIRIEMPVHALNSNGVTQDILNNSAQLKQLLAEHLSFSITVKVNGATMTTTKSLEGTGLALSAGPRKVKDGSKFNKYFPKPDNKNKRLTSNGEVEEVVDLAIQIVRDHHREAAQIAEVLKGRTVQETAANIFEFAYNYLQYRRDRPGVEELRTPARSWHDGQVRHKQMGIDSAGIDCDCYSIFCASILHCLNIPFKFRITKYYGRDYYQHIYVCIPATDNNPEIIIDPVLDSFNFEKPYSEQKDDFNMASLYSVEGLAGMPIEMLHGLEDPDIEEIISGKTFLEGLDGLGDVSDEDVLKKTYNYLVKTRDAIQVNPALVQNFTNDSTSLLNMLNDAIKYWHTPMRDQVLERLEKYEELLENSGVFKLSIQGLDGGLEGGFFKKIGRLAKKVGKGVSKVAKKGFKTITKIAKPLVAPILTAVVASNPLTMALAPAAGKLTSSLVNKSGGSSSRGKTTVPVTKMVQSVVASSRPMASRPATMKSATVRPTVRTQTYSRPVTTVSAPRVTVRAPVQSYATPMQTISTMSTPAPVQQPGFLARHKKKLLIGGGLLLVGTAAYVMFKPKRKPAALPRTTSRPKALAGPPAPRRTKKKRKPVKRKAAVRRKTRRGVKKVILR